MKLKEVYMAVAEAYRAALMLAGYSGAILSEDTTSPIIRPCAKIDMADSDHVQTMASVTETSVTFRLYFFAMNRSHPTMENLTVRQALSDTLAGGLTVGDTYIGIEDGIHCDDGDGVLEASFVLTWDSVIADPDEEDAELMETMYLKTQTEKEE